MYFIVYTGGGYIICVSLYSIEQVLTEYVHLVISCELSSYAFSLSLRDNPVKLGYWPRFIGPETLAEMDCPELGS